MSFDFPFVRLLGVRKRYIAGTRTATSFQRRNNVEMTLCAAWETVGVWCFLCI